MLHYRDHSAALPTNTPESLHRLWSRNGREGCSDQPHNAIAQQSIPFLSMWLLLCSPDAVLSLIERWWRRCMRQNDFIGLHVAKMRQVWPKKRQMRVLSQYITSAMLQPISCNFEHRAGSVQKLSQPQHSSTRNACEHHVQLLRELHQLTGSVGAVNYQSAIDLLPHSFHVPLSALSKV